MWSKNIRCPYCKSDFYESDWNDKLNISLKVGEVKMSVCPECHKNFKAILKFITSATIGLRYFVYVKDKCLYNKRFKIGKN